MKGEAETIRNAVRRRFLTDIGLVFGWAVLVLGLVDSSAHDALRYSLAGFSARMQMAALVLVVGLPFIIALAVRKMSLGCCLCGDKLHWPTAWNGFSTNVGKSGVACEKCESKSVEQSAQ